MYKRQGYEGPGQGCTAIIRAQKQKSVEWKVTLANLNHVNQLVTTAACAGMGFTIIAQAF